MSDTPINFSVELHEYPTKNGYWIQVYIRDGIIKEMAGLYIADDYLINLRECSSEPMTRLSHVYNVSYIFLGKNFGKIDGLPIRKNPDPDAKDEDDDMY